MYRAIQDTVGTTISILSAVYTAFVFTSLDSRSCALPSFCGGNAPKYTREPNITGGGLNVIIAHNPIPVTVKVWGEETELGRIKY